MHLKEPILRTPRGRSYVDSAPPLPSDWLLTSHTIHGYTRCISSKHSLGGRSSAPSLPLAPS